MTAGPTTDRPAAGSPWGRHCPDAYPVGWFDALGLSGMPAGFTRFATDNEAALIAGRIDEGEYIRRVRPDGGAAPSPPPAEGTPTRPAGGDRFRVLNGFTDFALRCLNRGEIAVWLVLYRDTRDGVARTSQADIARRAGLTVRGVQKVIARLRGKGLLEVVRRGRLGTGPSSYRVGVPSASGRGHDEQPGSGCMTNPRCGDRRTD